MAAPPTRSVMSSFRREMKTIGHDVNLVSGEIAQTAQRLPSLLSPRKKQKQQEKVAATGHQLLSVAFNMGSGSGQEKPVQGVLCDYSSREDALTMAMRLPEPRLDLPDAGRAALGADGSFSWLRVANAQEDRCRRKEVVSATLAACNNRGYSLGSHRCRLQQLSSMLSGTRLVRADEACKVRGGHRTSWSHHQCGKLLEVALQKAQKGKSVAIVNAASAYHVGGGFNTGGRHALEESLNTQTTLFQSLLAAKQLALAAGIAPPTCAAPPVNRYGVPWQCHIPEDGCILSPNVEIFRGDTNEGYPFLEKPVELAAVVSVAVPNLNTALSDAPYDCPRSAQEYEDVLRQKFIAVLFAAAEAKARVVVMPDVGCGVYGNDPRTVGRIFGEVVDQHFANVFDEIHLVGKDEFVAAAESAGNRGAGRSFW